MPQLTFWFEFASTYSYLSAMRIGDMAAKSGVAIAWKPFLLGPIFKAQGWETSPFNLYPAKGQYMVRDIGRIAKDRGLAFQLPTLFPQNGLLAARLAILGLQQGWGLDFIKSVFRAEFSEDLDISRRETLAPLLAAVEADPAEAFGRAESLEIKAALRANTDEASAKGIFGAPSFTTPSGQLFWGDDRLEQALAWTSQ
jgi:2-hydroxychromene-2-carboxylate isomerase